MNKIDYDAQNTRYNIPNDHKIQTEHSSTKMAKSTESHVPIECSVML